MTQKKSIAISACLLGHKVRYEGAHQENKIIIQRLADRFNITAVCPEVEIGLGVPREKIELHQQGTKIHLLTSIHPVTDLTEQMNTYAQMFLSSHKISGMILKDKSPSCGVANCKQWNAAGEMQHNGTGIFAATLTKLKPDLPMLQSNLVSKVNDLDDFIQKVTDYEY
ncbi:MAG TPA: DUF523 domain-containing protein [Methyloprofundus sp.]|uniref:DUF523 domain-containing protein n=1 Tax=Methyloprofundus sp. TaxID=2020875 RepID=UPI0017929538|nr:DUF523 domain-containing protein [Methyloprofundus sp.]HIG65898.1 DUF523 domain-containing protein [Methyloprofundus sp.]HIL77658.1 DUF523 domain-containing protein [Methylococcales bacterium]